MARGVFSLGKVHGLGIERGVDPEGRQELPGLESFHGQAPAYVSSPTLTHPTTYA
jgi:hypothetical protein